MRIRTMTATFGKLEHETLTLEPGLNILQAPNEWGKSTWTAFLLAMLYGLDTRAKTTRTALADKERYAPWSGAPMSGRIELQWQGREITIERHTKRRIPLGEFRAYETGTGLPVPELTAANCGRQLLGVEQSVFRRAGFIRQSDLPVTQDEALRRRLNALVTTGDESGTADRLEQQLKELKNRIRYNRSGLLPQAETRREALEARLQELTELQDQSQALSRRLQELKQRRTQLENHLGTLRYREARADAQRVAQAREARDRALEELTRLEHAAAGLPELETARREAARLEALAGQWDALELEWELLPPEPQAPAEDPAFCGCTPEEALEQARRDRADYAAVSSRGGWALWAAAGILAALCAGLLWAGSFWAAVPAAAALAAAFAARRITGRRNSLRRTLTARYGSSDPEQWLESARQYAGSAERYRTQLQEHQDRCRELEHRRSSLRALRREASGGRTPEKALQLWKQVIRCHEEYQDALRRHRTLEAHLQDLTNMARRAEKPDREDGLEYSREQTQILLNDTAAEQQRLQHRLGQYAGRMEALGDPQELKRQLRQQQERIALLEDRYAALTIAQETLLEARQELQRRFAPRIAGQARELMAAMTGGRYDRLVLAEDFSVLSGAESEDTLHDALWRSDGTADQLYLALRLAVARTLTPEAPLILDDALVRFDDTRLKAALEILREESRDRQILLFTCHSREKQLLS